MTFSPAIDALKTLLSDRDASYTILTADLNVDAAGKSAISAKAEKGARDLYSALSALKDVLSSDNNQPVLTASENFLAALTNFREQDSQLGSHFRFGAKDSARNELLGDVKLAAEHLVQAEKSASVMETLIRKRGGEKKSSAASR